MREQDKTELPAPNARRWTIRRKLAVVQALHDGDLTLEQARERYALSSRKFVLGSAIWNSMVSMAYGRHGSRFTADPDPISTVGDEGWLR
jgi:hypothetical protein